MKQIASLPQITVGGVRVDEPLRLAQLQVVQRLNAPTQCRVSWRAPTLDIPAIESARLAPGAHIEVQIEQQSGPIFKGEITAVEQRYRPSGAIELQVRAYDALARLQRRQSLETYVDVSTAELARALAEVDGLGVNASGTGPVWARIVPRFKHNLALLRHYAARSGLHFVLEEGDLRLFPLGAGNQAFEESLELTLGKELIEARLEQNELRPLSDVQVSGWDLHTGEQRGGATDSSGVGQVPNKGTSRHLLGRPLENTGEAEALARAELEQSRAEGLLLWGVAEGDQALRPGRTLKLRGVASKMAEPFCLTRVSHQVNSEGGYLSEISSHPEPIEEAASLPNVVLGEVVDVDDPEKRGRVQVGLASHQDAVSTWLLVMQQGAGEGKGLVSLPEVGDQVLVILPEGDPSRGMVLGGLYGPDGPPHQPGTGEAQHFPYTLATRGGQWMQLNDSDGAIRFENAAGSYLALTPTGVVLHSAGDLTLESPGKRLQLRADRIDLDRG